MVPLGGLNSKTGSSDFRLGLGAFVGGKKEKKNDTTEGGGLCAWQVMPRLPGKQTLDAGGLGLNDVTPP